MVTSEDARVATAAQWAEIAEYKTLIPNAVVTLCTHRIALSEGHPATTTVVGILVTLKYGPLKLRREYLGSRRAAASLRV